MLLNVIFDLKGWLKIYLGVANGYLLVSVVRWFESIGAATAICCVTKATTAVS